MYEDIFERKRHDDQKITLLLAFFTLSLILFSDWSLVDFIFALAIGVSGVIYIILDLILHGLSAYERSLVKRIAELEAAVDTAKAVKEE